MSKISEQFITDEKGNKIAVIISIKKFEKLNEDLHDLSVIAQRRKESTLSFSEMESKFYAN